MLKDAPWSKDLCGTEPRGTEHSRKASERARRVQIARWRTPSQASKPPGYSRKPSEKGRAWCEVQKYQAIQAWTGLSGWTSGSSHFASRFLELDGCRVHYFDESEGPPLLLLHSNPTWSLIYREIVKGLRDRFRCIALDYPGFGLSTARNVYGFTPVENTPA